MQLQVSVKKNLKIQLSTNKDWTQTGHTPLGSTLSQCGTVQPGSSLWPEPLCCMWLMLSGASVGEDKQREAWQPRFIMQLQISWHQGPIHEIIASLCIRKINYRCINIKRLHALIHHCDTRLSAVWSCHIDKDNGVAVSSTHRHAIHSSPIGSCVHWFQFIIVYISMFTANPAHCQISLMCVYIHAYMHTHYIQTNIHTYIHTYISIYISWPQQERKLAISIYLSVSLSLYLDLSIYLSLSICISIYLYIYLYIYLSLSISLSIYLSTYLSLLHGLLFPIYLSCPLPYIQCHITINVLNGSLNKNVLLSNTHWSVALSASDVWLWETSKWA